MYFFLFRRIASTYLTNVCSLDFSLGGASIEISFADINLPRWLEHLPSCGSLSLAIASHVESSTSMERLRSLRGPALTGNHQYLNNEW